MNSGTVKYAYKILLFGPIIILVLATTIISSTNLTVRYPDYHD
jgi:hypothetical protein